LARHDEISSTEKLLDLIRGDSEKNSAPSASSPAPLSTGGVKSSFFNAFTFKKKIIVGVDIGRKGLRMAKMGQSGDKHPELLDYKHIPFDPSIPKTSPRFFRFLNSSLTNFCDNAGQFEIWCIVSSANVETRYLRIPKVPKKQISNAVFWTYKKDMPFNDQSDVFDYEVLGDIIEDGISRIEVMAYSAPKQEIDELANIFSKSGYPLTGISIVPFALQNLFRSQWVKDGKHVCSLFIGSDWSRIAIFSNGNLVLSRDIKAGIKSMLEAIRQEIDANQPVPSQPPVDSDEMTVFESDDEDNDIGTDQAQRLLTGFIENAMPTDDTGETLDVSPEKVFSMIQPALDRVIRQVERTIRHYQLQFGDEGVGKLYISGQIITNPRMADYFSSQLDLSVESIDPFIIRSFLSADLSIPDSESERGASIPAVGMALSSNSHTPNFIFTYLDKERLALSIRIKRLVFGVSLLLMAICIGFSLGQGRILDQKKSKAAQLQSDMEKFSPIVDQNLIIRMVTKAQRNIDTTEAFVKKYQAMAIISEITQITPAEVRLSNITVELGWPHKYQGPSKTNRTPSKLLIIEGIIFGDRLNFEASLAEYLVNLKRSPMFSQPVIKKKHYDFYKDKEVLRFNAQLELT
jgi:Tfp pilus assembly PilM family ATPase